MIDNEKFQEIVLDFIDTQSRLNVQFYELISKLKEE